LGYERVERARQEKPVPGETDTSDNTLADGSIIITIPGDLNGDFNVTHADFDIGKRSRFRPGDPDLNPNADLNNKGVIGLTDLVILVIHYGQRYP
jgi:hypothetical protein